MPSSHLEIRPAGPADAAALAEILCRSWETAFAGILRPEELAAAADRPARTKMFEEIFAGGECRTLAAFDDGIPCGFCSFSASRDADLPNHGEIIALHTVPEYWGRAVGKALLQAALAELWATGHPDVLLWTFEKNARARRFYEKNGFVFDGTTKAGDFSGAPEVRYRREETP